MKRPRYYVMTYDYERETYTPQKGVRKGPYTLFGLRKALRALAGMGYDTGRQSPSVLVEVDKETQDRQFDEAYRKCKWSDD
jgi:hypothetical protein